MAEELIYVENELNGVIGTVPAHYLEHPILGAGLKQVRNGKVRGRFSELLGTADAPETGDVTATPADVAKTIADKAEKTEDK